ncbi:MAG: hypothetical protein JSW54_12345 [Fidelibacterota bacterium]|nr:MAG: hypothetical protein JSW54_12345 [Candidatus Neomarinimicrobiota bacterium]
MIESAHKAAVSETIEHLTARWVKPDKSILKPIFPLLSEGQPVSVRRIVEATGANVESVEQSLELGMTSRDLQGDVTELFGITLAPTTHRLHIGDTTIYSCCALIAQMVPLLIQEQVTIESVDPISHGIVRLRVAPSGIETVDPEGMVCTLVRTDLQDVLGQVSAAFCSHVHHFESPETACKFVAADSRRYTLDVSRFHETAGELYDAIWA